MRALLIVMALLAPHAAMAKAREPVPGACEPFPRRDSRHDTRSAAAKHKKKPRAVTGVASYYGPEFNHRRTASGERYRPGELTAAHPTLPFGTRLRVTNLDNGRHVVVRVNDRGPFAHGRVLDLSRAAARQLGFLNRGTARVKLEVLSPRRPRRDPLADDLDERDRGLRPTRKRSAGRA